MRISREPIHHAEESLRCMHLALPAFRGGLHRHGHLELTWIERGQGLRWVGDGVAPFFDGDLVLLGSEIPHLWATQGPQPAQGCTATVLQFPPDWTHRCGLPELKAVAPLMARASLGLQVHGGTRAAVQRLLGGLPQASALQRVAVLIEVLDRLQAGTTDLQALSSAGSAPASAPDSFAGPGLRRIDRVLNWIEGNLADDLRIDDGAAVAHLTPAAFGRFFRREIGKSFTAYVNDARCGWAALRLIQGTEPIAQVAHGCGFPTLSNFSEQFKRRHGTAPRDFRAGRQGSQGHGRS